MKLTGDQINYLNIGLMVLSCFLAYIFPFELFLVSYAVLGPLHYLTEISWLHDRRYFVEDGKTGRDRRAKRRWLILVMLTLALMLYGYTTEKIPDWAISPRWEMSLFYLVFVTALLTLIKNRTAQAVLIALALISLFSFSSTRYYTLIAFFLATIIHVFIFTGAFILYGALKSRSLSGILSLAIFVLCAALFFVYVPESLGHTVGDYVRASYVQFQTLNAELIRLFRPGTVMSLSGIYESSAGLMVMRLIAFAYTYHYLNWFSKTSIIKWYEIPKSRTALIIGVWLGSLALYAYSYEIGIMALYFLSILHVMLEFPLNHRTFAGIGKELHSMAR
ncbi:MAG TPA: hypothetical protein VGC66_23490 [Pyrinomonadaceae bacterium]|jgi:hypothetical protein